MMCNNIILKKIEKALCDEFDEYKNNNELKLTKKHRYSEQLRRSKLSIFKFIGSIKTVWNGF